MPKHPTLKEPNLQDEVKHKTAEVSGTVIAKYPGSKIPNSDPQTHDMEFIDVRGSDEKIYYASPAINWDVVRTEEELMR